MGVSLVSAPQETESVKKQYTKLLDGYGCLGVLQLNAGKQAEKSGLCTLTMGCRLTSLFLSSQKQLIIQKTIIYYIIK
jgi:hypothetical protein